MNWGLYTALSQTLLKLTSPGVPDIYQGQELWDFSLVDPDNRRPVDFARRREMLAKLRESLAADDGSLLTLARRLVENPRDSQFKLFVTWRILQLQRQYTDLFQKGKYIPLEVQGSRAMHICAFAREYQPVQDSNKQIAIIIAPAFACQIDASAGNRRAASAAFGFRRLGRYADYARRFGVIASEKFVYGSGLHDSGFAYSGGKAFSDFPRGIADKVAVIKYPFQAAGH